MKKRAFTLVEMIGVIVVLALILILVTPAILKASVATRQKLYETKVANIKTAAIEYGQDNYRDIITNANAGTDGYQKESTEDVIFRTKTITVKDLVPTYLTKDSEDTNGLVKDPRDNTKYLDEYSVTIKINPNTRKVTAVFNE